MATQWVVFCLPDLSTEGAFIKWDEVVYNSKQVGRSGKM